MNLGEQAVNIHTISGVQLFQFGPEEQINLNWTREWREVSHCELTVPVMVGKHLPYMVPWLHWVSVWDNQSKLLWTGPIEKITIDLQQTEIKACDLSGLAARTRVPITKKWDGERPEAIADELWRAMLDNHGLLVSPDVKPDPEGDVFKFECETDVKMLDALFDELEQLGLSWTVSAGTPLLGVMGKRPIAALGLDDFVGNNAQIVRDGERMFNDILVRGQSEADRYRVDLHGLNLQTLVNIDKITGVSSVQKATRQYARYVARVRDSLVMSGSSVLHPDAPVLMEQLVPSTRFVVDAYDMLSLMELSKVSVTCQQGSVEVSVDLDTVVWLPEFELAPGKEPELVKLVEGSGSGGRSA